jgi:tripartite-type tricarboxylate transporter receptor subunit TctC
MLRFRTLWLGVTVLLAALLAVPQSASAQRYPTRPADIIVPTPAGSVTDIVARIVANEMGRQWDQPVIVENRPPLPGTAMVARANPDGYTLMLTSSNHVVAGLANKNLGFDPVKDFAGITLISAAPYMLVVNRDVQAKTVDELIEFAKAKPGMLKYSSPGFSSSTFIAGALFRQAAWIDVVHWIYKGTPESIAAVVGGDVQLYFAPIDLAKELAADGKVFALALANPNRSLDMPNAPTFTEASLPFVYADWFGLMAPANVPREIIEKVNKDVVGVLQKAEVKAKFAAGRHSDHRHAAAVRQAYQPGDRRFDSIFRANRHRYCRKKHRSKSSRNYTPPVHQHPRRLQSVTPVLPAVMSFEHP